MLFRVGIVAFVLLGHCGDPSGPPTAEPPQERPTAVGTPAQAPAVTPAQGREEAQRRAEAVRRAVEEVALRGIATNRYLINLSPEDDRYRVAFVNKRRTALEVDINVLIRRDDFEILAVEGAALPPGQPPATGRGSGSE